MMEKKRARRVAFGWWVAATMTAAPTDLTVVGSDLMGPEFRQEVTAFAARHELPVKLDLSGSRLGQQELDAGRAELGIFVRPDETPKHVPEGWERQTLGYHTMVVVTSTQVPISQLDLTQVQAIYGAVEGNIQLRWGDVGVIDEWRSREIDPAIVGPQVAIAHDLLRYRVLRSPTLKPTVEVMDSAEAVYRRIEANPGAIGIVAGPPEGRPGIKALLLSADKGGIAYGPTPENVRAGDYPIRLPISVEFKRADAARLFPLLRHMLGQDGADALRRDGVIPPPVSVRNKAIFDLESF